jgi:hypothetical protein
MIANGRYDLTSALPLPQYDSEAADAELIVHNGALYVACRSYVEEGDQGEEIGVWLYQIAPTHKVIEDTAIVANEDEGYDYQAMNEDAEGVYKDMIDRLLAG